MDRIQTSVLVVEDNPGDARLIQEYLRDSELLDASLEMVTTLAGAVEALGERPFDVMLLDLSLSDSTGLGSVRVINRLASTTPIVVLSGNEDFALVLQSVQAGAQDYLPKQDASTSSLSRAISGAIERQAMLVERETLATIGRIISSNLDIDVVFGQFAEQVKTLIPVERMVLSWADKEENCLVNRHTWGALEAPWEAGGNYFIPIESITEFQETEEGAVGWGESLFGVQGATTIKSRSQAAGYQSAMFVPLRTGDATNGVLCVVTSEAEAYTAKHLRVLHTIGSQISGAIHASELYDKAVLWTEEREQRILLEAQKQELERINQVKSQIITTVSHELKTPLTIISAFIDILSKNRNHNLDDRQLTHIEVLRRNASHLHLLINVLLDHSKVDSGAFELFETAFDANLMLQSLGESFEPLAAAANQSITLDIPSQETMIVADQNRISQTISNMLSNATKYAGDGAEVVLQSRVEGNTFSVFVIDDGNGMDNEAVDNAFEIYYSGENPTTRAVSGLGLGLNISKRIVNMHHGEIFLSSAPGKGTRIGFEIPVVARSVDSAA